MKKTITLLCASGLLALLLAGCGGTPQVSTPEEVAAVKNNQAQHDADLAKKGAASGRSTATTGR